MNTVSAAHHAGVTEDQLRYWCKIGLVTSTVGGSGRGDRRWWTPDDLRYVLLARDLMDHGAGTRDIRTAIETASGLSEWQDWCLAIGADGEVIAMSLEEELPARYWQSTSVWRMVNLGQIVAQAKVAA